MYLAVNDTTPVIVAQKFTIFAISKTFAARGIAC